MTFLVEVLEEKAMIESEHLVFMDVHIQNLTKLKGNYNGLIM
jgi:hypothetical protein